MMVPDDTLTVEKLDEWMNATAFKGADLHPRIANCTAVAMGVCRLLPSDQATVVSVYDVEGLVHSAILYEGHLFDSRGLIAEGKETFISWSTDFVQADVDAACFNGTVEEFILSEYIEEYDTETEVDFNTAVADKAEELFQETMNRNT